MIDYLLTRAFAVVHVKVPVVACLQSYPLQCLLAPAAPAQPVAHPAGTRHTARTGLYSSHVL